MKAKNKGVTIQIEHFDVYFNLRPRKHLASLVILLPVACKMPQKFKDFQF